MNNDGFVDVLDLVILTDFIMGTQTPTDCQFLAGNAINAEIPTAFALHPTYPNPFNPVSYIRYDVKNSTDISIQVFDINGRLVKDLVHHRHEPGSYNTAWDADTNASGVYIIVMKTATGQTFLHKILLLK